MNISRRAIVAAALALGVSLPFTATVSAQELEKLRVGMSTAE